MLLLRVERSTCAVEGVMTGDATSAVASDAVRLLIVGDWRRSDGQPLLSKGATSGRLKEGGGLVGRASIRGGSCGGDCVERKKSSTGWVAVGGEEKGKEECPETVPPWT